MKTESAPQISVDQYQDIADDFLEHIIGHPEAWISDESCISDFDFEIDFENGKVTHDPEKIIEKTKERYGVDISGIADEYMVKIFERIRILSPKYKS